VREEPQANAPPFCPNPDCYFHGRDRDRWHFIRAGFFSRECEPRRIQRYRCRHCGRYFSTQTFSTSYWLKRPELLLPIAHRLLACSGNRQIAREFSVSHTTILGQAARLGRHCLLFHQLMRPKDPIGEPIALDSFISFEYSQYWPCAFHLAAGRESHFFYGFTDSPQRRSGRMTKHQKCRRAELEKQFGRPDPRAVEHDVATLLETIAPRRQKLTVHTDEHQDYPRAIRRARHLDVRHETISSRAARTARNPLFDVNLLDLLIRHGDASHKRETIAFAKRRQASIERMALLLVWRNYSKYFSERKRDATPAMRLGLLGRPLTMAQILERRLFPSRSRLPNRWLSYYLGAVHTGQIKNGRSHRLKYAA
jgi:transposase-like protein